MRTLEDPDILRAILESIHAGVYFVGPDQRIQLWTEGTGCCFAYGPCQSVEATE
jgi:hypothetical protein